MPYLIIWHYLQHYQIIDLRSHLAGNKYLPHTHCQILNRILPTSNYQQHELLAVWFRMGE